jgi:hypothetical protein
LGREATSSFSIPQNVIYSLTKNHSRDNCWQPVPYTFFEADAYDLAASVIEE